MATRRQQTMSKMAREREVKERRARKLEKKHAAAAARKADAEGSAAPSSIEPWAARVAEPSEPPAETSQPTVEISEPPAEAAPE